MVFNKLIQPPIDYLPFDWMTVWMRKDQIKICVFVSKQLFQFFYSLFSFLKHSGNSWRKIYPTNTGSGFRAF